MHTEWTSSVECQHRQWTSAFVYRRLNCWVNDYIEHLMCTGKATPLYYTVLWFHYYSALPISRGNVSPNNSRNTHIARPNGRAMGFFRGFGRVTEALKSELLSYVQIRVILHRDVPSLWYTGFRRQYQPHKQVLSLEWRHNGRDGVSNHRRLGFLFNRLFRRRSKKTSKLRVTDLCEGNSPVTGEFPAQRASIAENVSIW